MGAAAWRSRARLRERDSVSTPDREQSCGCMFASATITSHTHIRGVAHHLTATPNLERRASDSAADQVGVQGSAGIADAAACAAVSRRSRLEARGGAGTRHVDLAPCTWDVIGAEKHSRRGLDLVGAALAHVKGCSGRRGEPGAAEDVCVQSAECAVDQWAESWPGLGRAGCPTHTACKTCRR